MSHARAAAFSTDEKAATVIGAGTNASPQRTKAMMDATLAVPPHASPYQDLAKLPETRMHADKDDKVDSNAEVVAATSTPQEGKNTHKNNPCPRGIMVTIWDPCHNNPKLRNLRDCRDRAMKNFEFIMAAAMANISQQKSINVHPPGTNNDIMRKQQKQDENTYQQ